MHLNLLCILICATYTIKKITEIAINVYHKFMEKMDHIFGECVSLTIDLYLDIGMQ